MILARQVYDDPAHRRGDFTMTSAQARVRGYTEQVLGEVDEVTESHTQLILGMFHVLRERQGER
jgi:hypothetical protein